MSKNGEKRFYWVEGVTRDEVLKSLADQRPTRLRQQSVRRALVIVNGLFGLVLAGSRVITGVKLRTYLEFILMAGMIYLYLSLRRSVRHISDAPDELLDERLIVLRNSAYLVAYRYLFAVTILLFSLGHWILRDVSKVSDARPTELWQGPIFSFLMLAASLPAMVLAWTLPSEKVDD
jgi:hypothetical protein